VNNLLAKSALLKIDLNLLKFNSFNTIIQKTSAIIDVRAVVIDKRAVIRHVNTMEFTQTASNVFSLYPCSKTKIGINTTNRYEKCMPEIQSET
jgi:hypothetical protein